MYRKFFELSLVTRICLDFQKRKIEYNTNSNIKLTPKGLNQQLKS